MPNFIKDVEEIRRRAMQKSAPIEGEDPGVRPLDIERSPKKKTPPLPKTGTVGAAVNRENPPRMASDKQAGITNDPASTEQAKELLAERAQSPVSGTTGRTMNRRANNDEVDPDDIAETPNSGANMGGTRSVKILEKNRKNRRIA